MIESIKYMLGYLTRLGLDTGYLVLFHRDQTDPETIGKRETLEHESKRIHVLYV